MTEHDTPSTALVLTFQSEEDAAIALMQRARDDERRKVLAQVREGIKTSRTYHVPWFAAYFLAVSKADALAVVDRLEGKP